MRQAIYDKGWFVSTISGLAAGDYDAIVHPDNRWDSRTMWELFDQLRDTRVAKLSSHGWWTLDHPLLGLIQWKRNLNSATDLNSLTGRYLVRLNGQPLLLGYETFDGITTVVNVWAQNALRYMTPEEIQNVETFLGPV